MVFDYELVAELGRGGMGRVLRMRHGPSGLDVAVKTLILEAVDERAAARLLDEVRVVARLHHPGIVQIFDVGQVPPAAAASLGVPAGSPFVAMELAEAGSLEDRREALTWEEVAGVMRQLLDALAHAHARGIVHCDVKEANVLRAGPELDDLRLADFGVAALVREDTAERRLGGTPTFMPPEQQQGRWRELGPWTDLFALARMSLRLLAPGARVPEAAYGWFKRALQPDGRRRFVDAASACCALDAVGGPAVIHRHGGLLLAGGSEEPTAVATAPVHASRGPAPAPPSSRRRDPRPPWPPAALALASSRRPAPGESLGESLLPFLEPPLVGRGEAQARLWTALEGAVRGGPTAIALTGREGIGTTRVARWLVERAAELGVARGLEVSPRRAGSEAPLVAMLRRHLRARGLRGAPLVQHLARVLPPERAEAVGVLLDPSLRSPGEPGADAAVVATVGAEIAALAEEGPVVVVLDDAPLDPQGMALAEALLAGEHGAGPILLVLVAREGDLADLPEEASRWEALGRDTIALTGLSDDAQRELVGALLRVDASVTAAIARHARGHPGRTLALLRGWIQRGEVVPGPEGYRVASPEALSVPVDRRALASARVEAALRALPGGARAAFEIACALGDPVDGEIWRRACEARQVDAACGALEARLLEVGLWRPVRDATGPAWWFADPWLPTLGLDGAVDHRALHRACAGVLPAGEARGRQHLAAGDALAARRDLLDAAVVAWRRGEQGRARALVPLLEAAVAEAPWAPEDADQGPWLTLRAQIALAAGSVDEARRRAEAASAWSAAWGDVDAQVTALRLRADAERRAGHGDEAAARLWEAAEVAAAAGATHARARALGDWAIARATRAGGAEEADAVLEEASRRLGDDRAARGLLRLTRAQTATQAGDLEAALAHLAPALDDLEWAGLGLEAAKAKNLLGEVHRQRGAFAEAERWYRAAIHELEAQGAAPTRTRLYRGNLALLFNRQRAYGKARAILAAELPWFERRGATVMACMLRLSLLPALAAFGDWARWDRELPRVADVLDGSGLAYADAAQELERAGDEARRAGEAARAAEAHRLAEAQYARLRREADRRRVAAKRA